MRTFSSVCVAVVIGVVFPISLLLLHVQRTILSPSWGVEFLREENVYSRALESAVDVVPLGDLTQTVPFLDEEEIRDILKKSLVASELQTITEVALREAYGLASTPGKNLQDVNAEFDLSGTVERLRTEASTVVESEIESLPPCSAAQLQKLSLEQAGLFECRPPGFDTSLLQLGIDDAVQAMMAVLPNRISVRSIVKGEGLFAGAPPISALQLSEINTTIHMVQRAYSFARILTFLSFIALALLTFLLGVLTRPSTSSLKWIGITYMVSALPMFILTLYIRVTELASTAFVTETQFSPAFAKLVNDMASAFASQFTNGLVIMSGIGVALGIGLTFAGFILPDRPSSSSKQVSVNDLNRKV